MEDIFSYLRTKQIGRHRFYNYIILNSLSNKNEAVNKLGLLEVIEARTDFSKNQISQNVAIEIENSLPNIFNACQKRKSSRNNYYSKPKNTTPTQEAQKIDQSKNKSIARRGMSR
jgi:hypothetical protein